MKQNTRRFIAGMAAVALLSCTAGYAFADEKTDDTTGKLQPDISTGSTQSNLLDTLSGLVDTQTTDKDETVYVIAGADGAVQRVIVSDWVKNPTGAATLSDATELHDIKNVKSDAGYTIDSENAYIWDAGGADIYYQGTTDKTLPVQLTMHYTLDGKEISPKELAGKSGKLEMKITYRNNEARTVTIDGKAQTMYVPFAMLTGMILDNTRFQNVTLSNGKLISDGDRTVAVGFALPGLQADLLPDETEEILPETLTLTADVTDFSLATTLTMASGNLFGSLKLDDVDTLDELQDACGQLQTACDQLVDGSSALYSGVTELLEKSAALRTGIKQLAEGAATLAAGTADLASGASGLADGAADLSDGAAQLQGGTAQLQSGAAALSDGAAQLETGLGTLQSNSATLNAGAESVFQSLLGTVQTQLTAAGLSVPALTIENYTTQLNALIAALSDEAVQAQAEAQATAQVTAAVEGKTVEITAGVTAVVREQVRTAVLATMNLTPEQYDAAVAAGQIPAETQAQVTAAVEAQLASAEVQAQISAAVAQQKQQLISENLASDAVQQQISAAVAQAAAGRKQMQTAIAQLDAYKSFYTGLQSYTAGVDTAYAGSATLTTGSRQLCDGSATVAAGSQRLTAGSAALATGGRQLADGAQSVNSGAEALLAGILTLRDGTGALIDGIGQLQDGAMQLSDGMQTFRDTGIKPLTDKVNGDLGGFVARLRAVSDLARSYQSFGGISDTQTGSVKFIYRTEAIG